MPNAEKNTRTISDSNKIKKYLEEKMEGERVEKLAITFRSSGKLTETREGNWLCGRSKGAYWFDFGRTMLRQIILPKDIIEVRIGDTPTEFSSDIQIVVRK